MHSHQISILRLGLFLFYKKPVTGMFQEGHGFVTASKWFLFAWKDQTSILLISR